MHFSPVNGSFPHKNQIDRTCLVKVGSDGKVQEIQRGQIIAVNSDGRFELADTIGENPSKGPLYFALQNTCGLHYDTQAAMAGQVGFGFGVMRDPEAARPEDRWPEYGGVGRAADGTEFQGAPAITGLSFQESGNYQTDMFDMPETGSFEIGDPLAVSNGRFVKAESEDGAVAHVYAPPSRYYANDAVLREGWSTGRYINVIRVSV